MSIEIEIKGHGGGIGIVVLGYENPAATNSSDANWLVSRVRVGIGPFRGEVSATFCHFVYHDSLPHRPATKH